MATVAYRLAMALRTFAARSFRARSLVFLAGLETTYIPLSPLTLGGGGYDHNELYPEPDAAPDHDELILAMVAAAIAFLEP